MHLKIFFTFTALLFLTARGDPDPRTFYASTPAPLLSSPSPFPEFQAKEVIAYLTEQQLEDLKTGRGVLEPVIESEAQPEDDKDNLDLAEIAENNYDDEQLKSLLEQRKKYITSQSDVVLIGNQKAKSPLPVKVSDDEEPQEAPAQITWYPRENNRYFSPTAKQERNRYYTATTERPEETRNLPTTSETPVNRTFYVSSTGRPENSNYFIASSENPNNLHHKSINYYSVYNEKKGDNIDIKIFHPSSKDVQNEETKELDTKTESLSNKKYKPYDLRAEEKTQPQKYEQENPNEDEENRSLEKELEPKYAIRYTEQQPAIVIQNRLKKQKDQANISAKIPAEINRKVKTNKLRLPYIVHISQPGEIKAQKTYSLPLELSRPSEIEDSEGEKQVSYDVERSLPTPGSKQVYVKVDRPYLVERIVPERTRKVTSDETTPQKLRILGRIWQHYN